MPYQPITIPPDLHIKVDKAVRSADMFLHDVYGMFQLPVPNCVNGGGCAFSIALVLLCVIDGISCYIYPTSLVKNQEKRFKKLIRDRLYRSQKGAKWISQDEAANQLYLELRNPLVHELGTEKVTRARTPGHDEPNVGKWGKIPKHHQNIDYIDNLTNWNDDWPTLYKAKNATGQPCIKLCNAALYWSVKRLLRDLITDPKVMAATAACHDALTVLGTDG